MTHLRITLFGSFSVQRDAAPAGPFTTDKTRALLAYLVLEAAQPVRRELLATLLWPDYPTAAARRNLTQTLVRLRRALREEEMPVPAILLDQQHVQVNPAATILADVTSFTQLSAAALRHCPGTEGLCGPCAQHLTHAVALVQGEFMAGFNLSDSEPWDAWITATRESLHTAHLAALDRLAASHLWHGDHSQAAQVLEAALRLDSWNEERVRQHLRCLARTAGAAAAQAEYAAWRARLEAELGVDPEPATVAAVGRLGLEDRAEATVSDLPAASRALALADTAFPASSNPFIGRAETIERFLHLWHQPTCRLVTITGVGGVGKTRLALQLAPLLAGPAVEIRFVALQAVSTRNHLITALGQAGGIVFVQGADPETHLRAALRTRRMVMVLDNVEQLAPLAALFSELLAEWPQIKFLATSRVRLNLLAEHVFDLHGLDVPAQADDPQALEASAVRLFLCRARALNPDWAPAAQEQGAIIRLCQFLEGHPLALELAARWTRLRSCEDLVSDISRNLADLSSDLHDLPDRQRSWQALIDSSWGLLGPEQQAAACGLAVFQGTFSIAAALAVAATTPDALQALEAHGFLRGHLADRYSLHPLMHQYVGQQAARQAAAFSRTCQRYAAYYARLLRHHVQQLNGADRQSACAALAADAANLQAAWAILAQESDLSQFGPYLEDLVEFYAAMGWHRLSIGALALGLERADQAGAAAEPLLKGRWQRLLGDALQAVGDHTASARQLARALTTLGFPVLAQGWPLRRAAGRAIVRQALHRSGLLTAAAASRRQLLQEAAHAYRSLGYLAYLAQDPLPLFHALLECLNLAEESDALAPMTLGYSAMCLISGTLRWHSVARAYRNRAERHRRSLSDRQVDGWQSLCQAIYALGTADWERARTDLDRAIAVSAAQHDQLSWFYAMGARALLQHYQGDFGGSAARYQEVHDAAGGVGNASVQAWALGGHAWNLLRLGQPAQAAALLEAAQASGSDEPIARLTVRAHTALAALAQRRFDQAWEHASQVALELARIPVRLFALIGTYRSALEVCLTLWEQTLDQAAPPPALRVIPPGALARTAADLCARFQQLARVFPLVEPAAWRYKGWLAWLQRRNGAAYHAWQQSLAAAERLAMPYEAALTYDLLGRYRPADCSQRRAALNQALVLFSRLGAEADRRRVAAYQARWYRVDDDAEPGRSS